MAQANSQTVKHRDITGVSCGPDMMSDVSGLSNSKPTLWTPRKKESVLCLYDGEEVGYLDIPPPWHSIQLSDIDDVVLGARRVGKRNWDSILQSNNVVVEIINIQGSGIKIATVHSTTLVLVRPGFACNNDTCWLFYFLFFFFSWKGA
ncbi:hypothetical protein BDBG_07069 [Blastomyces gilchristii SLH14081]|uniref:Uncharacterized protein n=1 Tax=Blastomyces gilchristii (strain SLH14081) TaxID=559298 RepID=A0A179UX44_BLAGS|nr:uncharacterized protein BDBG_07069 [Blastomyces gilchristii SLH14081]OAT11621.1 hypothetical protein BDBG_07069 [Blastomyces gilchristii SLH14081]